MDSSMRTVSFVDHLEFESRGTVFCKAIKIGDVDNDQGNELVVGSQEGDIEIFKGSDPKPWRRASDLGMITSVEIANVCNHGINYVITTTVEGWCYVFSVKPDLPNQENNDGQEDFCKMIKPAHTQHLTANSKVIIVADIDGDGCMELVIGFSDRQVRSYRWLDVTPDPSAGTLIGKFVPLEVWHLAGQLSAVTVHSRQIGLTDLMVSQPGGAFVTLHGSDEKAKANITPCGSAEKDSEDSTPTNNGQEQEKEQKISQRKWMDISGPTLVYHPLGTARARNPSVTSEILGNISRRTIGEETYAPSYCAVCTLDGTLTLVDNDKILWSFYVDHQLFTLAKLDITGNGTEEVIACSTDGHTYIVNHDKYVVRFNVKEEVAAFAAGPYAISGNQNIPCLIYITFNNKIIIYYNVHMPHVRSTNLIQTMQQKPEHQELLNYFNCDASRPDQVRQLYHWCLYGFQSKQH